MSEAKKRILFIVAHRLGRSPGQRFRFEQYLQYLNEHGFDYTFSHLIREKDDRVFYSKGKYFSKLLILLRSMFIRFKDTRRAKHFDIVFIYREAWMLGSTFFERKFARSNAKVVTDFDDAIWIPDTSLANKNLSWLKNPEKTKRIVSLSDLIFVGNNFLASYASKHNSNVKVIPTTIDTDYYTPCIKERYNEKICIGWTGSLTTLKHLQTALPFLKALKDKYGDKIYFKLIADVPLIKDEVAFEFCKWSKENEVDDLQEIDIGIMPLPDDEWSKGKCGFKGLQYMALEIPAVMSPVGVNIEIIEDGVNGYLANTDEEWITKLSALIDSETLRKQFGVNGRQTIVERFSFHSQKENYVKYLKQLLD